MVLLTCPAILHSSLFTQDGKWLQPWAAAISTALCLPAKLLDRPILGPDFCPYVNAGQRVTLLQCDLSHLFLITGKYNERRDGVAVGVDVGDGVQVGVGVTVGEEVAVGDGVAVLVGVTDGVAVGVSVGTGAGSSWPGEPLSWELARQLAA